MDGWMYVCIMYVGGVAKRYLDLLGLSSSSSSGGLDNDAVTRVVFGGREDLVRSISSSSSGAAAASSSSSKLKDLFLESVSTLDVMFWICMMMLTSYVCMYVCMYV